MERSSRHQTTCRSSIHPVSSSLRSLGFLLVALVWAVALLGCGRTRYYRAQTVADAGDGQFWLAGTEGVAALWDGRRIVRRDYPLHEDAPDWGYGPMSAGATATILMDGDTPYLFTRVGDVFRRGSHAWERLPVDFRAYAREPQVNAVLRRPGGGLVIQLHSDVLLWTSFADLAVSRFEAARTPTYFTSLSHDPNGTLYGYGWANDGSTRAVAKRTDGRWEIVAKLGQDPALQHEQGMAVLESGTIVLAFGERVFFIDARSGQYEQRTPAELAYLGGAKIDPAGSTATYAARFVTVDGGAPLLFVSGDATGAVRLSPSDLRFVSCRVPVFGVIGAIARDDDMLVVDSAAQMWSIREQGCTAAAPPSIN